MYNRDSFAGHRAHGYAYRNQNRYHPIGNRESSGAAPFASAGYVPPAGNANANVGRAGKFFPFRRGAYDVEAPALARGGGSTLYLSAASYSDANDNGPSKDLSLGAQGINTGNSQLPNVATSSTGSQPDHGSTCLYSGTDVFHRYSVQVPSLDKWAKFPRGSSMYHAAVAMFGEEAKRIENCQIYAEKTEERDAAVTSFKVAKVFRDNTQNINSMDFSFNGEHLITSADDETIHLYDVRKAMCVRTFFSNKYGVDLVRCTHADYSILHNSTKGNNDVRYLSLYDNKYLRSFPGHKKKVVALEMSPMEDTFLSCSQDKTLRLWDLRDENCRGVLSLPGDTVGSPIAAFDAQGLIIAVGTSSKIVQFYDVRAMGSGPYKTFEYDEGELSSKWTTLKFSQDGLKLLVGSNGNVMHMVDAAEGIPLQTFGGYLNPEKLPIEACFSSDSEHIFGGSSDGKVHIWNVDTGDKVSISNAEHPLPVQCIKFNPHFEMFASACKYLAFWAKPNSNNWFNS